MVTYANGTGKAFSYDSASRLVDVNNPTDTGAHHFAYTYDKIGNRLRSLWGQSAISD